MKQKIIDCLKKYPNLRAFDLETSISFLESASDEDLKRLGHAVLYFTSPPLMQKLSSWYNNSVDCSFMKEYRDYYGISQMTSADKILGSRLIRQLKDNPNLTAKEFLSTQEVVYNEQVRNAFKTNIEKGLVSIHNHPSGYPPSLSDLASLQQKNKNNTVKYGLTAGHDGSVYWYTRPKRKITQIDGYLYANNIDKYKKMGYNEVKAQELTLSDWSEKYGFDFGKIQ